MNKYSLACLAIIFLILFTILKKLLCVAKLPILNGKHVMVTGGSSGIGKSAAIKAAKLGANVTIIARNAKKLELAVEEIKKAAKNPESQIIKPISLDVAKAYKDVEDAVNLIEDTVGPIFLLINCAGTAICGKIDEATEFDYRYMMELNYLGTVFPTLVVAKKMKMRKKGHIVITGSQGSLLGIYGMSAYCSSKFALRGFAESLYMEMLPYNVGVTLCLPPDTNTPGFENEEKTKPLVTKLISETAGLFEPDVVAHQLLSDTLNGQFFSIVGFESLILTTLCSGMSPVKSLSDGILQISLMSFLKLVSIGYLFHFNRIIYSHLRCPEKKSNVQKD